MKDDGGCAFPVDHGMSPGMSLRDYFAAVALQGILANSFCNGTGQTLPHASIEQGVELAYKYADAMLIERTK